MSVFALPFCRMSLQQDWLTQSRLLVQQDKLDEAIGVLREATRHFEDDRDVKARLAQLYSDYSYSGYGDPAVEIVSMLKLNLRFENEAAALIQEPLAELVENTKLAAVVRLENDYIRVRKLKLVGSYIRASLAKGDYNSVASTLEQIVEVGPDIGDHYSYGGAYYAGTIGDVIAEEIFLRLPKATQDELIAMLPVARLVPSIGNPWSDDGRLNSVLPFVAHALAGQIGQYDQCWNGIASC